MRFTASGSSGMLRDEGGRVGVTVRDPDEMDSHKGLRNKFTGGESAR